MSPIVVTPEGQFQSLLGCRAHHPAENSFHLIPPHELLHHTQDGISSPTELNFERTGSRSNLVILFTIDALAAVIPSCAGLSDRRCIFWLALDRSAGAIRSKVDQLCKHPGNTSRDKAAFVLCFRQRQSLQTSEEAELMRRWDWPHPIQYFDNSHIYIYLLAQQRAASILRHRKM